MTTHDPALVGPQHGAHAFRRASSWRPGRVLAVVLTTVVVGAGTWLLGAGSDRPAPPSGISDTGSLPAGSAPPLAVAPPPSGAVGDHSAAAGNTAAAGRRPRSVAAGAH